MEEKKSTVLGIGQNLEAVFCYALTWVSGIIFLAAEKENRFVRFHALQSILVFGSLHIGAAIMAFIPFLGWLISFALSVTALVLYIVLMVKAYQGEQFKVPLAGKIAEEQLGGRDTRAPENAE